MKMTQQSSLRNPLGVTAFPSSEPWVDEILQERLRAFKAERVTIRSGWDGYAPLARWYQNDPEAWEIPHVSGLTDHIYRLWVPYRNNKQKKEKIYVQSRTTSMPWMNWCGSRQRGRLKCVQTSQSGIRVRPWRFGFVPSERT
jgi:hypothetical protein